MTIREPATALTDYLMALLAAGFAVMLGGRAASADHARWWSRSFALLAASAVAGGTFHGFEASLPPAVAAGIWRAALATAALSSFATMRAVALQWLGERSARPWTSVAAVKLALALVAGAYHPDFAVVVLDFGLTMLFAAGAGVFARARNPRAFAALAAGVALFAVGALVQQARLSPHPAFNHNDLFHAIQILGNVGFFLSAWLGSPRRKS